MPWANGDNLCPDRENRCAYAPDSTPPTSWFNPYLAPNLSASETFLTSSSRDTFYHTKSAAIRRPTTRASRQRPALQSPKDIFCVSSSSMSSRSLNLLCHVVRNARTSVYRRRPRFPRRTTGVAKGEALRSSIDLQQPCAGDIPVEESQWVAGIIVSNLLRIFSEPKRAVLAESILCRKFIRLL